MKSIKRLSLLALLIVSSFSTITAQNLEQSADAILAERYPSDGPGVTALVAKDGKVLYRKAFGMANLELGIPMQPENVFEIGSITKQFTAVCILMLQEQGKLNVEDDITKFIPDYPTKGKKITVHQLLNHTSGIRSYTSMDSFMKQARVDMTPTELIDVFKNEPMDFDPGEQYEYNNSAYIVLGHIIEVVSGKSYADFLQEHIFDVLGMKNSHYGSKTKLIKNRASGYQPTDSGYRNADYLSMTLPYAAGSIMSCVDDMLLWSQAVHNNTLISEKSKQLAFNNGQLNNGDYIYYGYGWDVNEINGTSSIEHGGGIFGYTTFGVYIPSENIYTIILANSNGNDPTDVTVEIAAHALGKPFPKPTTKTIAADAMKKWESTYEFEEGVIRYITFADGGLWSQRDGSQNLQLYPVSENEYVFEGSPTKYIFTEENGKRVANFSSRIRKSRGVESDKPLPEAKESITLDASVIKKYEGTYELQPGFEIVITTNGNQIFAQATGQPEFEIFAENDTTFFLKVVQAQIVFTTNNKGIAESLTLYQGGQEMLGKKKS